MSSTGRTPPSRPGRNVAESAASASAGTVSVAENHDEAGASGLRKASVRLVPLIALAYGVAYTDRVNISFAALQMNRDLHFSASTYGLGAGLFFLSYAGCEIPSNLLLVRFGARRWIARIMLTWGLLAMGMMFVRTPLEFYAMRFLLGMAEAGFFPGVIFYLSQWFPAKVRARSVSRFYIALPLSSVFMGAVAGALLNLQGRSGLAGWQWLFLLEGLPAIVLSVVFFAYLPDTPTDARWLTPAERGWLLNQLRREDEAIGHGDGKGVLRAILDPRVWQVGMALTCIYIGDYALRFSAPLIIQQITGFSNTKVGFVIALLGVFSAASMVLNGSHSDRTGERYLHVAVPCLLMAAAFVVAGTSMAPALAIPAYAVASMGFTATGGPVWTIPSSFLSGESAAAGIATVNAIAITGGFIGPYWLGLAKDFTGNYQTGLLTIAIPAFIGAAIVLYMRHQVKKRAT